MHRDVLKNRLTHDCVWLGTCTRPPWVHNFRGTAWVRQLKARVARRLYNRDLGTGDDTLPGVLPVGRMKGRPHSHPQDERFGRCCATVHGFHPLVYAAHAVPP